jgi:hypothetical protein
MVVNIWIVIAINLAISALVYVLSPKPPKPDPLQPGALDVPQPKLGSPIPVIFGEDWVEDAHISYYGNSSSQPIKKKGGK